MAAQSTQAPQPHPHLPDREPPMDRSRLPPRQTYWPPPAPPSPSPRYRPDYSHPRRRAPPPSPPPPPSLHAAAPTSATAPPPFPPPPSLLTPPRRATFASPPTAPRRPPPSRRHRHRANPKVPSEPRTRPASRPLAPAPLALRPRAAAAALDHVLSSSRPQALQNDLRACSVHHLLITRHRHN